MTFVTNYRLGPRLFLLGLTVLVLVAGYVPKAAAACGPFPRIPLWKSLSHDLVRQQVEDAYDGDWKMPTMATGRPISLNWNFTRTSCAASGNAEPPPS